MAGKKAIGTADSKNGKSFVKDPRFQFSLGVLLLGISFMLFISFFSFLFTWKIDQSFNFKNLFESLDYEAENWSARIGAVIANLFINKWFGISSFGFPFIIGLIGFQLLKIKLLPLGKAIRHTFFFGVWLSIFLGFIFADANGFLGSGPGGRHGLYIAAWMNGLVGKAGTLSLLIISLFIFLAFSFSGFLPWASRTSKALFISLLSILSRKKKETSIPLNNQPLSNTMESSQNAEDIPIHIEIVDDDIVSINQNSKSTNINQSLLDELDLEREDVSNSETVNPTDSEFQVEKAMGSDPADRDLLDPETSDEDEFSDEELVDLGEFDPTLDLSDYKMPPLELLEDHRIENTEVSKEELISNKNKIVETLSHYKIKIDKIKATIGPTITLYEIVPAPGIRIAKIKNLEDDIAMSLAALGIRIIAPMPGKGTVGIEVPNQNPEIVSMRSILSSTRYQESKFELPIALGKTISNDTFVFDLTKMPHLLVAGATGQGKSVGLNAILASILYKKHPSEVKFVLVDPKKVELTLYADIEKHYLAKLPDSEEAIITDTRKVVQTLNSLTVEMDHRYDLLKKAQVRNIKEYNAKFRSRRLNPLKGHHFLPYIVLVIDEFADLIMTAGKEIETPIARIAQLARAIGIHLIIATQRPSTNIITGVIKANFPARLAFRVTSMIDSRTILDTPGANQLIGRGDLLFSSGNDLTRVQCAFIDTPELEKLAEFIGSQRGYPSAHLLPEYKDESEGEVPDVDLSRRDELFDDAARLIVLHQQGSTSLIQRKFSIGYNRAGRIMDQLEAAGIVGPSEGSKARQVYYSDEYSLEQYLKNL